MRYALAVPALLAAAWACLQDPDEETRKFQEHKFLSTLPPAKLTNATKETIAVSLTPKGKAVDCPAGRQLEIRPRVVVAVRKKILTEWVGGRVDVHITPKGGKPFRATLHSKPHSSPREYRVVGDEGGYRVEDVTPKPDPRLLDVPRP